MVYTIDILIFDFLKIFSDLHILFLNVLTKILPSNIQSPVKRFLVHFGTTIKPATMYIPDIYDMYFLIKYLLNHSRFFLLFVTLHARIKDYIKRVPR